MLQDMKDGGMNLLIISDDVDLRNHYRTHIEQVTGFCKAFSETNDPSFATTMVKEQSFDCILLDFRVAHSNMTRDEYVYKLRKFSPDSGIILLVDKSIESRASIICRELSQDYLNIEHITTDRIISTIISVCELQILNSKVKKQRQQMQYIARHDSLTGLPNRVLFKEALKREIAFADRHQCNFSLLFLDLDNFKTINDTLGHQVGDLLLKEVSKRLKLCLRADDFIARLGGDEFAIILRGGEKAVEGKVVADKIIDTLKLIYRIDGKNILTTISIGIADYPDAGEDFSTLLKSADLAMYQAKSKGRNNVQFHTAELHEIHQERLTIETQLGFALEREEFNLVYQPKVDLYTNKIKGIEALIRWQNPKLGNISPGEFIPIAESTGLINPIGEWVLKQACYDFKYHYLSRYPDDCDFRIAINLSPCQLLQDDLVEKVDGILNETGVDPKYIEFELTETAIMNRRSETDDVLNQLKSLGILISIDDFGTGYALLSQLNNLPISTLKIALSFVQKIESVDDNHAKIVKAIINLAENLGLDVIAEGVETETQRQFLLDNHCENAQGFYFSRPVSFDEIDEIIASQRDDMPRSISNG